MIYLGMVLDYIEFEVMEINCEIQRYGGGISGLHMGPQPEKSACGGLK